MQPQFPQVFEIPANTASVQHTDVEIGGRQHPSPIHEKITSWLKTVWNEFAAAFIYTTIVGAARATGLASFEFASVLLGVTLFLVMRLFDNATGNPTIQAARILTGRVEFLAGLVSIGTQLAGALLSAVLIRWGMGISLALAVPTIGAGFNDWNGFVAELFPMLLVSFIAIYNGPKPHSAQKISGVVVAASMIAVAPISGASFSAWYHLSMAIVGATWHAHCWIYYVAPTVAIIPVLIAVATRKIVSVTSKTN